MPKPSPVASLPVRRSSRLSGFHRSSPGERRRRLVESGWLSTADAALAVQAAGFSETHADAMVENAIGVHGLPLAVALNFVVNGRPRVVPMAVEEPSIVAAASYAAKLVGEGGGFEADADLPVIAAQVQLLGVADDDAAVAAIEARRVELLEAANALIPRMVERGGGAVDLEVRRLEAHMLCVHVYVDCRDAMGANTVNTVAEGLAPRLAALAGATPGLRILSNLADRRRVRVSCRVPTSALASDGFPDGGAVRDAVVAAQRFAELDSYRAVTHNKGVMNGVDAVLVACGNDWRAVEAGAHAWAARSGRYGPLTRWSQGSDGALVGSIELPLAANTVGGAAGVHPGVQLALRLAQPESAVDLAVLAAAAGLASNLAALKALATEGIQRGHMALHARRVAVEGGAEGELIELVAAQLAREGVYRKERASEVLVELRARRSAP